MLYYRLNLIEALQTGDIKNDLIYERNAMVEEKLGIPMENVLIASIHQHSCPAPYNSSEPTSAKYRTLMVEGIRKSIKQAVDDLTKAVDGDLALCEAAASASSFFHLVQLGVPFPTNEYGEYIPDFISAGADLICFHVVSVGNVFDLLFAGRTKNSHFDSHNCVPPKKRFQGYLRYLL